MYAHKNPDQISLESSNPKICDKEIAIYIKSNEFITCCFTHMWLNYAPLYWVLYTRLVRNQVVQYTKFLALIVPGFKKVPLFGNVRRFLLNLLKFLHFFYLINTMCKDKWRFHSSFTMIEQLQLHWNFCFRHGYYNFSIV